jgi:hypothetical protein
MARGQTIRISIVGNARDAIRALRETRRELRETQRAADKAGSLLARNSRLFQKLAAPGGKAMGLLTTTVSLFAVVAGLLAVRVLLIAGALVLALPAVLHLTAALVPLLGLAAGAPALLAGAAAGFAAFKVATSGIGAALQAGLDDNTELFAKKMALIPPAAQQFVKSILGMRVQLRGLRATVSNAFFAPFAGQIAGLGRRGLPVLQTGLARVAASLGRLVSALITTVGRSQLLRGVAAIFKATARAVDNARPGITRFLAALGRVFLATAPVIARVGRLIGTLLSKFSAFLTRAADTGTLKRWFNAGWRAAGQLWSVLRNVFGILRSVLNAGSGTSGTTLLGTLDQLTARLDAFFKSAQGKLALKKFFDGLGKVIDTIGRVVRTLWPIAGQVANYFTHRILPAVEAVVGWLAKHKDMVLLLLKVLAALYVASKALAIVEAFHRNYLLLKALLLALRANPLTLAVLVGALIGYKVAMGIQSGAIQKEWNHLWEALSTRAGNAARDWHAQFIAPTVAGFGHLANVVSNVFTFMVRNAATIGKVLYKLFLDPFLRLPVALFELGASMIRNLVAGLRAGLGKVGSLFGAVAKLLHIPGADSLSGGTSLGAASVATQPVAAGTAPVTVNVNVAPGADLSEAGRHVVRAVEAYQRRTGRVVLAT